MEVRRNLEMHKLAKHIKPFGFMIVISIFLLLVQAICELALPDLMSQIINIGIPNAINTGSLQNEYIIRIGSIMLIVSLISAISILIVGFLSSKIAAGFALNLRKNIFSKIESFSNVEFDKFSTASLITRTTNDVIQIQTFVFTMLRIAFYAPLIGIGGVIKALSKSPSMSWTIALAVIVLLGIIIVVLTVTMNKYQILQKLVDKVNLITRENLTGIMVVRAFNTQSFEEKRFDIANESLTNTQLFINRVMAFIMPAIMFIMNGTSLLIIWIGAREIASSTMLVGDMMAFMQYAMQIILAFLMLSMMFIMLPRALVSIQRVKEILEVEPIIKDSESSKAFNEEVLGEIEFRNVFFRHSGAKNDVLRDISFKIMPGETTAIVGSTGAGKTTIINLILRLYDVSSGEILIDNVNVKDIQLEELRSKIGYIPQKAYLFSGSIESNLRYANENIQDSDIKKAIEISQIENFINESSDGLETEVAQSGTNLSGGQKQRISIARALLKKAKIYIFDDSFSALDFKTDSLLRKALKNEIDTSTRLIVAQRISSVKDADKIIVVEDGEIVGIGNHNELMDNCDIYREIALSQLPKEDIE